MQGLETKRLEQVNSIVQVAAEMGLRVRDSLGPCFRTDRHADDNGPTLFFNVAQNTFFCKTCRDVGGGVLDFVCQYKGWERQKAIDWLTHRVEFDQQTREMYYSKGKKKG